MLVPELITFWRGGATGPSQRICVRGGGRLVDGATPGVTASDRGSIECPKHMTYGPCGGVRPDGVARSVTESFAFVAGGCPLRAWLPGAAAALGPDGR